MFLLPDWEQPSVRWGWWRLRKWKANKLHLLHRITETEHFHWIFIIGHHDQFEIIQTLIPAPVSQSQSRRAARGLRWSSLLQHLHAPPTTCSLSRRHFLSLSASFLSRELDSIQLFSVIGLGLTLINMNYSSVTLTSSPQPQILSSSSLLWMEVYVHVHTLTDFVVIS